MLRIGHYSYFLFFSYDFATLGRTPALLIESLVGFLDPQVFCHKQATNVLSYIIYFFRKLDVGAWAGPSWLRIGTGGGNL